MIIWKNSPKSAYSTLGKDFGKQTAKQVGAIKSLDISNKKNELEKNSGFVIGSC